MGGLRTPHRRFVTAVFTIARRGCHSASHFSHFFRYLSSSMDKSLTTNVSTTLAKNSDACRSFASSDTRSSCGKEA